MSGKKCRFTSLHISPPPPLSWTTHAKMRQNSHIKRQIRGQIARIETRIKQKSQRALSSSTCVEVRGITWSRRAYPHAKVASVNGRSGGKDTASPVRPPPTRHQSPVAPLKYHPPLPSCPSPRFSPRGLVLRRCRGEEEAVTGSRRGAPRGRSQPASQPTNQHAGRQRYQALGNFCFGARRL